MLSTLTGRLVRRERLDAATRAQMFALMQLVYEGASSERFAADLTEKQYVILIRVRATGELAGFSTVRLATERLGGRDVEVLFSGDTVIHPAYWGQKTLQRTFARLLFWRKLRRPFQPLFWLLLSGGYKTYLLMMNYFPRSQPRHDSPVDPARNAMLVDVATRWFGTQFDPTKGILRFAASHYRVRDGVAPIDRETARHPHIAFFARMNPGHVDGDELVCLGQIRLRDLGRAVVRILAAQVRGTWRRLAGRTEQPALVTDGTSEP